MVLAPTLSSFSRHGLLAEWNAVDAFDTAALVEKTGANPGYLRIALKALANQGWLTPCGSPSDPWERWNVTPLGRRSVAQPELYSFLDAAIPLLAQIAADPASASTHSEALSELRRESLQWHRRMLSLGQEVLAQYALGIVAAIGFGLLRWWREGSEPGEWASFAEEAGWAHCGEPTPLGRALVRRADLFDYVLGYAPLLAGTETLLFGDAAAFPRQTADSTPERHVIRRLDIDFSGKVFAQTCRGPFFDLLLPLFDSEDLNRQPKALVDVGCGNGLMLAQSFWAICHQTRRGRHLGEFPLDVVGLEYQEVALEGAAETLRQLQVPGRVLRGDISNPEQINGAVNLADALVVCKSTIHNRRFLGGGIQGWDGRSEAAAVDSAGRAVSGGELFSDLCAHFAAWRKLVGCHGMIVIEPHATPSVDAARNAGRSLATVLEITHGYSQQLLVEPALHLAAVAAAGWKADSVLLTGGVHFGHDYMSFARLSARA